MSGRHSNTAQSARERGGAETAHSDRSRTQSGRPSAGAGRPGQLPGRDEQCVWMTAGLVTYKLCDRNFECEGCPLNQAFCSPRRDRVGVPPPRGEGGRGFHPAHTWAQRVEAGRVRVGVDAFAAELVGRVRSVVLPAIGGRVKRGQVGCWLVTDEKPVPLLMPLSGIVMIANGLVRRHPTLVVESPLDEGWLIEVGGDDVDAQLQALGTEADAETWGRRDREWVAAEAASQLGLSDSQVGPTLCDGGLPVGNLRRMLGSDRHYRLLVRLLTRANPT